MSNQAIKNFFTSQKRLSIKSSKPKKVEDAPKLCYTIDAEESIRTGKYFDTESLYKYLSTINFDQYIEEVDFEPEPVVFQEIPKVSSSVKNIRLVDLTDEMMFQKEQEESYREEEEYFKCFQEYVPPPRPISDIDIKLNQMIENLEKAKKELDDELIKQIPNTKGYVPPTRKKEYNEQFNPNVSKLKTVIFNLENGIKDLTTKINKENERWVEYRKLTYRSEYIQKKLKELSAMQEEIVNYSGM